MKYEVRKINDNNVFVLIPIDIKRCDLTGSEKQIAWANALIDTVIRKRAETDGCHVQRLRKGASGMDWESPEAQMSIDALATKLQDKYDNFFAHASAAYYIDKLKYIKSSTDIERIQATIVGY